MTKALLITDYTRDFVDKDGKLWAGKSAVAIEAAVSRAVLLALGEDAHIFICSDLHEMNDTYHPETDLFPAHNIKGTEGRELFGKVGEAVQYVRNAHPEYVRAVDKTRYSAFAGTRLDIMLRERGINEVTIVGVMTDICILHTAIDAYNYGYKIKVPQNAVASINMQMHDFALDHIKNVLGGDLSPVIM